MEDKKDPLQNKIRNFLSGHFRSQSDGLSGEGFLPPAFAAWPRGVRTAPEKVEEELP